MTPVGRRVVRGGTSWRSADQAATLASGRTPGSRDGLGYLRLQVLASGRDLNGLGLACVDSGVHEQLELGDDAARALEGGEQAVGVADGANAERAADLGAVDLEGAGSQHAHGPGRDPDL